MWLRLWRGSSFWTELDRLSDQLREAKQREERLQVRLQLHCTGGLSWSWSGSVSGSAWLMLGLGVLESVPCPVCALPLGDSMLMCVVLQREVDDMQLKSVQALQNLKVRSFSEAQPVLIVLHRSCWPCLFCCLLSVR